MNFGVGTKYSRADVKEIGGLSRDLKGGNWDTGIVEHNNEFIVFANVGTEGRTGHDYGNAWEGDRLRWYHKSGSHLGWPSVRRLLDTEEHIHVFVRSQNDQAFTYAGLANPIEIADTSPVEILWALNEVSDHLPNVLEPTELPTAKYAIGAAKQVTVNAYERDPIARQKCLDHYGYRCSVCNFSFEDAYGEIGSGFVHVHHLLALYLAGAGYEVDPIQDLRPVCPNCHAMLHRRRPPYSIEEIKSAMNTLLS